MTIQQVAEKTLLSFYALHRKHGVILKDDVLNIESDDNDEGFEIECETESFVKLLTEISGGNAIDMKNALVYLEGKGFISFSSESNITGEIVIYNIVLLPAGIDIVEGVDGAETSKSNYQVNFNVKLAENINVENLLKAELGSILKLI